MAQDVGGTADTADGGGYESAPQRFSCQGRGWWRGVRPRAGGCPERAQARVTLTVEADADLTAQHHRLCTHLTAVLTEAGIDEPEATAFAVLDRVDGVLLHALTIHGREIDPARLEASLRALLG